MCTRWVTNCDSQFKASKTKEFASGPRLWKMWVKRRERSCRGVAPCNSPSCSPCSALPCLALLVAGTPCPCPCSAPSGLALRLQIFTLAVSCKDTASGDANQNPAQYIWSPEVVVVDPNISVDCWSLVVLESDKAETWRSAKENDSGFKLTKPLTFQICSFQTKRVTEVGNAGPSFSFTTDTVCPPHSQRQLYTIQHKMHNQHFWFPLICIVSHGDHFNFYGLHHFIALVTEPSRKLTLRNAGHRDSFTSRQHRHKSCFFPAFASPQSKVPSF